MDFLRKLLRKLRRDTSAKISPKSAMVMGIAFFLVSIIMPIGLLEVADANTTGWETPVITIFQVVFPILGVISIALAFLPGD